MTLDVSKLLGNGVLRRVFEGKRTISIGVYGGVGEKMQHIVFFDERSMQRALPDLLRASVALLDAAEYDGFSSLDEVGVKHDMGGLCLYMLVSPEWRLANPDAKFVIQYNPKTVIDWG